MTAEGQDHSSESQHQVTTTGPRPSPQVRYLQKSTAFCRVFYASQAIDRHPGDAERQAMAPRKRVTKNSRRAKYADPPLGRSERERVFLEFEQALICAAEAFYRFAGIILGPEGKLHKLTGQENVILQQLMFLPKARSVSDLSRFTNRDDI